MTDLNATIGDQRLSLQHVLEAVVTERDRQDEKWTPYRSHLSHETWLTILGEEFGESARAILEKDRPHLYTEVVQCAAVCVAWLQHGNFDRE